MTSARRTSTYFDDFRLFPAPQTPIKDFLAFGQGPFSNRRYAVLPLWFHDDAVVGVGNMNETFHDGDDQ